MLQKISSLFFLLFFLQIAKAQQSIISVKDQQFILNNQPYYFVGANYWYGGLLPLEKDKSKGIDRLRKELDFLKAHGITNLSPTWKISP